MRNLDPWVIVVAVAILSALAVSLARLLITWLLLRHASERISRVVSKALRPAQLMAATGGVQILLFVQSDVATDGWDDRWNTNLSQTLLFGTVISGAWLISNLLSVAKDPIQEQWGSLNQDDIGGRRRRTQAIVTYRLVSAGVWMVAIGIILFNIPALRVLGTSLLGAAGIAGVVAALAAQTMLQNLFAGMQLAFGDALRLEDVVVIEGEWGRIEEITLSYVVVRIWDERRLVLPTSYFKDHPYINWTRDNPKVLGTVKMDVDWRLPVEEARAELRRFLASNPLWDGRKSGVIVLDSTGPYMQLRMLISAANPSDQWDLRCEAREHMIRWVVEAYPHCIPRLRVNSYQSVMDVRTGAFASEGHNEAIDASEIQALLNEAPVEQRRPSPGS
ncbi:mechanosensitive ion channel family protein [Glycomyces sp. L485]|uniref:mechanosensitive ion channel family protein n=1 Tax=Glycomyces sp. L485 TaxID=2909235 RepID=UPI001F4A4977|nr:mechanosensitive ion channel domain-containing protein [Glycomyces sp. L485]MCH7232847.1 mechanosensitive ion channel family protein [Glycomyces sp. L485]